MEQQLIFFTNFTNLTSLTNLTDFMVISTIGDGLTVTEVGRMEAPVSSDTLSQQIAAAKQRLADRELRRQLAQNVNGVKSLLIEVIKQYNKNQGCGCYFKKPKAAQKARWQAIGPYVFYSFQDIDDLALMNIDGKDVRLKLVKPKRNLDPDNRPVI